MFRNLFEGFRKTYKRLANDLSKTYLEGLGGIVFIDEYIEYLLSKKRSAVQKIMAGMSS